MSSKKISRLLCLLLLALWASCATTPPAVIRGGDNVFFVAFPLRYEIPDSQDSIVVPAGFVTDLASIPKALHWWEGKLDRSMAAAIIHDYLYWDQRCTKDEADAVLNLVMRESGVSAVTRKLVYAGVRTPLAQSAYAGNSALKAAGEPRFFNPPYLQKILNSPAAPRATLKSLQAEALRDGGIATDTSNPTLRRSCTTALKMFHTM